MVCSTVVMMVAPPGLPMVKAGLPFLSTMVGAMLLRGRLPASGTFGWGALKSKSVISLFNRKP